MSITFKARNKNPATGEIELVDWILTDKDMKEMREQYPDVNVQAVMERAAAWTHSKPSKAKLTRNMIRWLTGTWLAREKTPDGAISRARRELSKPEWERRGLTEAEWRAEQQRKYDEKRQTKLALDPSADEEIRSGFRALVAELSAQDAGYQTENLRPLYGDFECEHQHKTPGEYWWCLDCGMSRHQFEMGRLDAEDLFRRIRRRQAA